MTDTGLPAYKPAAWGGSGYFLSLTILFVVLLYARPSLAGPPLATEDPGILEQGQWEIIAATTATATDGGDAYQLPVLDVSLGVIDQQVQIGATYPYVIADPEGQDSDSDFGNLELGVKWRFWNSEDLQVAFAPLYAFGITRSAAERGIGENSDVLQFPVVAEYRIKGSDSLIDSLSRANVQRSDQGV
jgi:hypothetical protein